MEEQKEQQLRAITLSKMGIRADQDITIMTGHSFYKNKLTDTNN